MKLYDVYLICLRENKRIPEYEPIFLTDRCYSYHYAKDIIKGRWPEAEPIFLTDRCYSYLYAKDIIKGRWPEAETIILTKSFSSYCYAKYLIKGRWPEAEPKIRKDKNAWQFYCFYFNIKKDKVNWKKGL